MGKLIQCGCDPKAISLCQPHEAEYLNEWKPREWDRLSYLSMKFVQPVKLETHVITGTMRGLDRIIVNSMMKPAIEGPVNLSVKTATEWRSIFQSLDRWKVDLSVRVGAMLWWGVTPQMFSELNPRISNEGFAAPAYMIRQAAFRLLASQRSGREIDADEAQGMLAGLIAVGYLGREDAMSWWEMLSFAPMEDVLAYREMGASPDDAKMWWNNTGKGPRRLKQWLKQVNGDVSEAVKWASLEAYMKIGMRGPKLRSRMVDALGGDADLALMVATRLRKMVDTLGEDDTVGWCADLDAQMKQFGVTASDVYESMDAWQQQIGVPQWTADTALYRGPLKLDVLVPPWEVSSFDKNVIGPITLEGVIQTARLYRSGKLGSMWREWMEIALSLALQRGTEGNYIPDKTMTLKAIAKPMDLIDQEVGPLIAAGMTPEIAASMHRSRG